MIFLLRSVEGVKVKISFQEQDSLCCFFFFFFFIVDTETHNDYVIAPVLFLAFIKFINKKSKYLVNRLSYFPSQQDALQTLLKQDETFFFLVGDIRSSCESFQP